VNVANILNLDNCKGDPDLKSRNFTFFARRSVLSIGFGQSVQTFPREVRKSGEAERLGRAARFAVRLRLRRNRKSLQTGGTDTDQTTHALPRPIQEQGQEGLLWRLARRRRSVSANKILKEQFNFLSSWESDRNFQSAINDSWY
jgi:hypothetical protein